MEQGCEQRRRRRIFVYKDFQPGFLWGFGVALLAALLPLVFSSVILLKLWGLRSLPDIFCILLALNLIASLAILIMLYWVALFISHRMGGPLVRLEAVIKSLGQGYLNERAQVRSSDHLQGFAGTLNDTLDSLQGKVGELKKQAGRLERLAQEVGAEPELRREIEAMRSGIDGRFVL